MNQTFRGLFFTVAALLASAAFAAGAPSQGGPFTLTLVAPRQPLEVGKPLTLRVKVRNKLERPISVPVSLGTYADEQIYHLHILDERGLRPERATLPKPKGGKGLAVVAGGSMQAKQLEPGETLTDEVNVSRFYDLSRPGKYKIWVGELFDLGPGQPSGLVKSNTITVTVVE